MHNLVLVGEINLTDEKNLFFHISTSSVCSNIHANSNARLFLVFLRIYIMTVSFLKNFATPTSFVCACELVTPFHFLKNALLSTWSILDLD